MCKYNGDYINTSLLLSFKEESEKYVCYNVVN